MYIASFLSDIVQLITVNFTNTVVKWYVCASQKRTHNEEIFMDCEYATLLVYLNTGISNSLLHNFII